MQTEYNLLRTAIYRFIVRILSLFVPMQCVSWPALSVDKQNVSIVDRRRGEISDYLPLTAFTLCLLFLNSSIEPFTVRSVCARACVCVNPELKSELEKRDPDANMPNS